MQREEGTEEEREGGREGGREGFENEREEIASVLTGSSKKQETCTSVTKHTYVQTLGSQAVRSAGHSNLLLGKVCH